MSLRPNHKARQARAGRANIDIPSVSDIFRKFKWFTLGLVVIFPIYPSLSILGSGGTVRAGDYDDSTIITAYNDYEDEEEENYISDTGLIRIGSDSSSSGNPKIVTKDSLENKSSVKKHTVKSRESIASISDKYGVSTDAVLWANDISMDDELKIGQVLKIPPISGVIHKVVSGDTISEIARKYSVSGKDIVSVNTLRDSASIRIGMELMIPGAIKKTTVAVITPDKTYKPSAKVNVTQVATKVKDSSDAKITTKGTTTISSKTGLKDRYLVKYTGKSRGFVGGNCTWYVAQNKTVTWRGNANAWMRNAKAAGEKTGSTPVVGAIIQFSGAGYNRYYGHVGIVAGIEGDNLIIKDMNYRGLYEVTIRKVPIDHPSIDGYIYVD
ncbi:LysM peptidoglycan-binding domain-containing protein [Candidatus Gracilibacteria bacterium]|nr:LysM peptidoglycan-binding domain-containing protein [Candidatus Gracilibacteria bacterium]